jgi:hypothetical protein
MAKTLSDKEKEDEYRAMFGDTDPQDIYDKLFGKESSEDILEELSEEDPGEKTLESKKKKIEEEYKKIFGSKIPQDVLEAYKEYIKGDSSISEGDIDISEGENITEEEEPPFLPPTYTPPKISEDIEKEEFPDIIFEEDFPLTFETFEEDIPLQQELPSPMHFEPEHKKSLQSFIEERPLSSYPRKVLEELALVSLNPDKPARPVGSYTYRFQQYPGDIDAMEKIGECCSKEQASKKYVSSIKRIVRNITSKRSHYYSEIKAGINPLFNFSVGVLKNGSFTPNKNLWALAKKYRKQKYITNEEYSIVMSAIGNTSGSKVFNSNVYDVVEYIFRKHRILRWSPD